MPWLWNTIDYPVALSLRHCMYCWVPELNSLWICAHLMKLLMISTLKFKWYSVLSWSLRVLHVFHGFCIIIYNTWMLLYDCISLTLVLECYIFQDSYITIGSYFIIEMKCQHSCDLVAIFSHICVSSLQNFLIIRSAFVFSQAFPWLCALISYGSFLITPCCTTHNFVPYFSYFFHYFIHFCCLPIWAKVESQPFEFPV